MQNSTSLTFLTRPHERSGRANTVDLVNVHSINFSAVWWCKF